jgi:hypothetical protein
MRLALVISALGAGGAERVIVTLANAWAARGWQVALITFEPPGTKPYYHIDRGWRCGSSAFHRSATRGGGRSGRVCAACAHCARPCARQPRTW